MVHNYRSSNKKMNLNKSKVKRNSKSLSANIGRYLSENIVLNEEIDKLVILFNDDRFYEKCSIDFTVNNLTDIYRFLLIFDGDEYEDIISKEEIINSSIIIITSYRDNVEVEKIKLNTKDIIYLSTR